MSEKIKVLLVDDHTLVRHAFRLMLEREADIEIVGEAGDGHQAFQLTRDLQPDIVLMDLVMPVLNGQEATREILRDFPQTKIIILTGCIDPVRIKEVVMLGITGYVTKQSEPADLMRAIRKAINGNVFFSPSIVVHAHAELLRLMLKPEEKRGRVLTQRETEVIQLLAEGRASKEIATVLGLSIKTIEKHRQDLMDKLGLHSAALLTRYAIRNGIIEP